MQRKGSINILLSRGLLFGINELLKFGVFAKLTLNGPKTKSYSFDLDHVKLSLGIFFFLSCLMESFLRQI